MAAVHHARDNSLSSLPAALHCKAYMIRCLEDLLRTKSELECRVKASRGQ